MMIIKIMMFLMLASPGKRENIRADKLWSDHLGNIYTLTDNSLHKYNQNWELLSSYDWQANGRITSVDISDPLRIVVFSVHANQVVFLDQELSLLSDPFNIDVLNYHDVAVVCKASTGGFWMFNNIDKQLIHINHNGNEDIKSGTIDIYSGFPEIMYEYSGHIYLGYPKQGIVVFNNQAAYEKCLPLTFEIAFEWHKNNIIYLNNDKIFSYNIKLAKEDLIVSSLPDLKDFTLSGGVLYYISNQQVKQKLLKD
ncbi:MAG: hypothetical protein PF590_05085 [Candidatus Delongbacteria bacterium]|nr:hypothetical protein [Candidatus Delongbacteria bacterium]